MNEKMSLNLSVGGFERVNNTTQFSKDFKNFYNDEININFSRS